MSWQKYKAKRTEIEGESFPSKLEANVYSLHRMLEKQGKISGLRRYPSVEFRMACQCGISIITGLRYKPDLSYLSDKGETIYVEAKGIETADWLKNKKLWKMGFGPGLLEIWKQRGSQLYVAEAIIPRACRV